MILLLPGFMVGTRAQCNVKPQFYVTCHVKVACLILREHLPPTASRCVTEYTCCDLNHELCVHPQKCLHLDIENVKTCNGCEYPCKVLYLLHKQIITFKESTHSFIVHSCSVGALKGLTFPRSYFDLFMPCLYCASFIIWNIFEQKILSHKVLAKWTTPWILSHLPNTHENDGVLNIDSTV